MATAARPRLVEQTAFDENVIEDPALEEALEERQRRQNSLNAVRKEYDEAHEKAKAEIEKQELPEGGAMRVGRFRIVRQAVSARQVSFDVKATSRVRISLVGDE